MFSDQDLARLFGDVEAMEQRMAQIYTELHANLTHPEYRAAMQALAADEAEHQGQVEELRRLFGSTPPSIP